MYLNQAMIKKGMETTINSNKQQNLNDRQLAEHLKKVYKINFNISQSLSKSEKVEIIKQLENNEAVRKLVITFIAKNQDLSNNNRKFGKQRELAKRDLIESEERNEELVNEISLIRFQLNEMKRMLSNNLEVIQQQLLNNMLNRSEIIIVFKELINVINKKEQVK